MIEHYLDTIARNYLKSEECKKIADEIKYSHKAKIKIYSSSGNCKYKCEVISTDLLSEAFEQMAENYKKKSVEMLQNQMEVEDGAKGSNQNIE